MMNSKSLRLSNFHYWLTLFLILYTSDSVYTCVFYKLDNFFEVLTELLMMLFVVYIRKRQLANTFIYIGCLIMAMLLLSLFHVENTEYAYLMLIAVRIMATMIFAYGCIQQDRDFYKDISNLIYYIAVFGLICYVLFEINPFGISPSISYVHISSGDHRVITKYLNFYNIYYRWDTRRIRFFGLRLVRENGFFREVGVYAIFLDFALTYFMFLENQINKKKVLVVTISIFLAQSTMGLLIMIIIYAFKLVNKNFKFLIITIPIISLLGIVFYIIVSEKFEGGAKVASRSRNLMSAIRLISENPIWGAGCHRKFLSWYGLLNYFIFWGIAGAYPVYIIIKGLWRCRIGLGFAVAFFSWYFLSLMNETAGYNLFFLSLYALLALSGFIKDYSFKNDVSIAE